MKNLKLFLVAGLLTVSAPAFAQFANTGNNSGSKRSSSSASAAVTEKTYSRIELSYNPISITNDAGDDDFTTDLKGISFGYVKGFSVSKKYPIYVEAGLRLTYAFNSQSFEDYYDDDYYEGIGDIKHSYLGLTIPVNVAYKFAIPNSEVSITPFVGVTLKGNILGKEKYEWSDEMEEAAKNNDAELIDEKDMFDKDDVGKDYQWKRFQFGWNIGANVSYNQFNVGFSYGSDFSELCEDTKTSNWAISVGYNF